MKSDILKYLTELNPQQSAGILDIIRQRNIKMKFKFEGAQKIHTGQITAALRADELGIIVHSEMSELNGLFTSKITVAQELYFFSSQIESRHAEYFVRWPFKIFKLIRRKNARYFIPASWPQSGSISALEKKNLASQVTLIELSLSGIKVRVVPELPRYEKLQRVKLSFRLFRRAEIQIQGIVRHQKNNPNGGQTLGVEFFYVDKSTQYKIQNMCADLVHALS